MVLVKRLLVPVELLLLGWQNEVGGQVNTEGTVSVGQCLPETDEGRGSGTVPVVLEGASRLLYPRTWCVFNFHRIVKTRWRVAVDTLNSLSQLFFDIVYTTQNNSLNLEESC